MRHLSSSADELIQELKAEADARQVVVVGSGYGGSVAALRLAERGVQVSVLERGNEYLSGEFPGGLGALVDMVRLDRRGAAQSLGPDSALFDIRLGRGIGALVGNALGGGSQINANVMMPPDDAIFQRTDGRHRIWPDDINLAALQPHLATARATLAGAPFRTTYQGAVSVNGQPASPQWGPPQKMARLQALANRMRQAGQDARFAAVELSVQLGAQKAGPDWDAAQGKLKPDLCVGCGECVAGCNFNAKKTLTHSYLPRAKAAGARLYTGVTVLRLQRDGKHWRISFQPTHAAKDARAGAATLTHVLRARQVILAAGTFGSTEILLRSRDARGGRPKLALSRTLGKRLSTNGDNLAAAYLTGEEVNGIGVGEADYASNGAGVGPTITGSIRVAPDGALESRLLIQDAAIPRALAGVAHELFATLGLLAQLSTANILPRGFARGQALHDWAALNPRSLSHTQLLLIMGHDRSAGTMTLSPRSERLQLEYSAQESQRLGELHAQALAVVKGDAGVLLENPALRPPAGLMRRTDDTQPGAAAFTVHPLGGCCMAEEVDHGVVDQYGRVFNPDWNGKDAAAQFHQGLYVLDGSIMPASIGVNPLLTITAIAERAIAHLLSQSEFPGASTTASPAEAAWPPMLDMKTRALPQRNIPVRFTEAMRSRDFRWKRPERGQWEDADALLMLHLPLPSLESFAADPSHTVLIAPPGTAVAGLPIATEDRALLRIDARRAPKQEAKRHTTDHHEGRPLARLDVVGGTVRLLPATRREDGWLRVLLTWCKTHPWRSTIGGGLKSIYAALAEAFLMLPHARESRVMAYDIRLRSTADELGAPRDYVLIGRKRVGYAASCRQLLAALWPSRPLERPDVWTAYGSLQARVYESGGRLVGRGTLRLDMIDMTRFHVPQLGLRGNAPDALLTMGGYAMWMLRVLIKTRALDFRAPAYPRFVPAELDADSRQPELRLARPVPLPKADIGKPPTYWPHQFPDLHVRMDGNDPLRKVAPEPFVPLLVPVSATDTEMIELRLIRYQQTVQSAPSGRHAGVRQYRSLLMLNGFAQSTLPLVATELRRHPLHRDRDDVNLATFFYEQGFDIWLFEYRTSSVLEASKRGCTMDDIAVLDIPAAVDHILKVVSAEDKHLMVGELPQIYAYGHCVGAATLAMSLLGGHLQHPPRGAAAPGEPGPGKLAGVVFSQMQAFLIGSPSAQARFAFGGLARDALGIEYFRLSAAEREPDALEALLDRLHASLPVDPKEDCSVSNLIRDDETDQYSRGRFRQWLADRCQASFGDECSCKRMSGTISRLFKHDRILPQTHRKLPAYFGRANTSLMLHASRCMEAERLVNADGQNVYVTDQRIRAYLKLPVALLHGKHNAVLNVESTHQTHRQIGRINPELLLAGVYQKIVAEDYAHFDCTIGYGQSMRTQILGPLRIFMAHAWKFNLDGTAPTAPHPDVWMRLHAPLSGPLIGWTRAAQRNGQPGTMIRLWIEVDESRDGPASRAVVQVGDRAGRLVPIRRLRFKTTHAKLAHIAVAVADVFVDAALFGDEDFVRVRMASVHRLTTQHEAHLIPGVPTGWLAPPLVDRLFDELTARENARERQARSADPGTVSRRRRSKKSRRRDSGMARLYRSIVLDEPGSGFSFLAASCRHPGTPFDRQRADSVLNAIADRMSGSDMAPRFMLMLGDQIYADATAGLMDSPSPVEKVVIGSRNAFSTDGFRRLVTKLPTYMVMDDHEITDSWSQDRLRGAGGALADAERLRDVAFAGFTAYQWLHSPRRRPPPGRPPGARFQPGRFGYCFESGAADFFVLDTRSHRDRYPSPPGSEPVICTNAQLAELRAWLDREPSRIKFIVTGSVIVPGLRQMHAGTTASGVSVGEADNWQLAPRQRQRLLQMVAACRSAAVVLLSGDYHCAALARIELTGLAHKRVYALAAPPLYAPYPALNVHPQELTPDRRRFALAETIGLAPDLDARVHVHALPGMGYMDIAIVSEGAAPWLQVTTDITLLDAADAPVHKRHRLRFPL
ncbi:MAG: alkaline phosphatase D family protein [Burkholderiales bacterium]|nr:alkaline phosphatase D family protein [Burkholderiales bacterium]